jgi:hypothetical protein
MGQVWEAALKRLCMRPLCPPVEKRDGWGSLGRGGAEVGVSYGFIGSLGTEGELHRCFVGSRSLRGLLRCLRMTRG